MARFKRGFEEKDRCESPVVCGTCIHAHFSLTRKQRLFLLELASRWSSHAMTSWMKRAQVGSPGCSVSREKTRAAQLMRAHLAYCGKEKVPVSWPERGCVFWAPNPDLNSYYVHEGPGGESSAARVHQTGFEPGTT